MNTHPTRMPAVFIGHGSPMNTLEHNRYTDAWRRLGETIARPRAILMVSAHWTTRGTAVTAMTKPRTIHDFAGFPKALFEVDYPAPGDPQLAARVRELLAPTEVGLDQSWGLDHGAWSVLTHVFPKADVPVVQLSLDITQPADFHYALAARLAPLRDDGVLIIGSGNVVHNLGRMQWADGAPPYDWAVRFNETVRDHLVVRRHKALTDMPALGKTTNATSLSRGPRLDPIGDDARLSIPTPEHYLPLLYSIAQQGPDDTLSFPVDGIEYGAIGMLTVAIGLKTQ